MKAGLIADIIVGIIILINVIICTRMGFIRCVLQFFSSILALVVAMLSAAPLTRFCEAKFGWLTGISKWNVPFISPETLLKLLLGIVVFVLVRLVCILIDKLLKNLKEKLNAVNIIDRILGTVFGGFAALCELTLAFMLINHFGWTNALSLTAEAGGYFAYQLFNFCRDHMFNFLSEVFAAAASATPKF